VDARGLTGMVAGSVSQVLISRFPSHSCRQAVFIELSKVATLELDCRAFSMFNQTKWFER
jgi:hypothetical protein